MIESKPVPTFEELLETWDGETAVIHRDRESGAWIFVCLHSTRLGPAGGGTRMRVYDTPAEGLLDAMRLSAGMTRKLAVAGLPFGGGKAVLAVPEIPSGEERRGLLLRYADLVASLGGSYRTSSDMNTGEADMDVIGERTEYVYGRSVEAGGSGSPAVPTAVGVHHGIRVSLSHVFGSDDLEGRSVLVQGAGGVGSPLADQLGSAGATVLVADIDPERADAVAARVGGTSLPVDQLFETDCDVYAPCAVGGVLSVDTVPRLRCRDRRRFGKQPAGRAGSSRTAARAWDPLCAGLRHQRGRRDRDRRSRAARLEADPSWTRRWRGSAKRYGRSMSGPTGKASRQRQPRMFLPTSG